MKTKTLLRFAIFFVAAVFLAGHSLPAQGQSASGRLELLDKSGEASEQMVDGNTISLRFTQPQAVEHETGVEFTLNGIDMPIEACAIAPGEKTCQTASFSGLGWFWNPDGTPQPERTVTASINGEPVAIAKVQVRPRPVVMVHGFVSSWDAWTKYLGNEGYLSELGISGFAVGDGRAEGVMNTGSLDKPTTRTNTIAQNAEILARYIADVQQQTGAEKVDLLVHSMGGMISRYYIDRLMPDQNVAQLIILGTPMAGSACAILPSALGMYLPTVLEIQPSYMEGVFNKQIYRRNGVPFYALAGTQIIEAIQSPCTTVPSDIAVSLDSLNAIPLLESKSIPLLHTDLNTSRKVFEEFVTTHLKTPPGGFPLVEDPAPGSQIADALQFTKVYTGRLAPGETQTITINIDAGVTVASFGLFDPSRSLSVSVTGASGKVIELDSEKNGLIQIDDPATLIYLGYGFKQPKPGKWLVTLAGTDKTPAGGTDFALTAQFDGGARIEASTDKTLPMQGEAVSISASLDSSQMVSVESAEAHIRLPDGGTETVEMKGSDGLYSGSFTPRDAGIYGIEISMTGSSVDGFIIDRAATLTVEAQPRPGISPLGYAVFGGITLLGIVIFALGISRLRREKK